MRSLSEREAFRVLASWPSLRPKELEEGLKKLGSARELARSLGARSPCPPAERWVARCDEGYPALLRGLDFPPSVIYYQGNLAAVTPTAVAVVGTRRASDYALVSARDLGRNLAEHGVQVVSGLARGVDAAVHLGSLEASRNTSPVAVAGCGLDSPYPKEHRRLQEIISQRGLVISEFAPGTPPYPSNFPRRNRLIAALAQIVVVVEAPERSGALITVAEAQALGRDVMAMPGRVGEPGCRGSNRLLQEGAGVVLDVEDILEELEGFVPLPPAAPPKLDPRLEALGDSRHLPEALCSSLQMSVAEVQAWLVQSVLAGSVSANGDGTYQVRRRVS